MIRGRREARPSAAEAGEGIRPGIENLPDSPLVRGARRIGLVAHPASLTVGGEHSCDYLLRQRLPLAALFGPEHGFFGRAGPGDAVAGGVHPALGLPIYSLYGETRAPTTAMLEGLDLMIFDLQTLACRAYTYVSTLRLVMEACAARHIPLVVADRADPLMFTAPDGPMLAAAYSSFVALAPVPFVYGLTPGEVAWQLKATLPLPQLDLLVARVHGLARPVSKASHARKARPGGGGEEVADDSLAQLRTLFPGAFPVPSPAIRNLEAALCFPATVFLEALPYFSHARASDQAFQVVSAPDLDVGEALGRLRDEELPGVELTRQPDPTTGREGIGLCVTSPVRYLPAKTGKALLKVLEILYASRGGLWTTPGARPEWLQKLWGAPAEAPFASPAAFVPRRFY
ncbi:MAG: DUF1343 domain-containing protein [Kiritimatiellae bacterium]|nr:DUF1343 domain-containing protein [Kiritimatiellia bacterium]